MGERLGGINLHLLKKLSEEIGVSGHEDLVRNLIRSEIDGLGEIEQDSIGNLYLKVGEGHPRVMISAHMDEIGFMVKHIDKKGFIRIELVGGWDPRVFPSQRAILIDKNGEKLEGVVGSKPPHIQSRKEMEKAFKISELFLDIGMSKEEVLERIEIGCTGTLYSEFRDIGDFVVGKALDDRVGVLLLIELAKAIDVDFETNFVFTVQEEVGLRGAGVAAYRINPDIALVVEATAAGDLPGVREEESPTSIGLGPAITIMDKRIIVSPEIFSFLKRVAEENNIDYQIKKPAYGGTDAGRIHITRSGIPSGIVSVPTRYIHSPNQLVYKKDLERTFELLKFSLEEIPSSGLY